VLEELWRDARHGLRLVARAPGFSAVAIVTLALAIGADTAVFSLVDAVLLKPLPLPDAGRLVALRESVPTLGFVVIPFSPADYEDFARRQQSFSAVGAWRSTAYDVSSGAGAERVKAALATASLFRVLAVPPLRGRTFTEEEDRPGARVAVLGYGLWQRRFGGAPSVVGSTLLLDREPYTIVGVMPASFRFPLPGSDANGDPAELWVPVGFTPMQKTQRGAQYNYSVVARLRPGVSAAAAAAESTALAARLEEAYPPEVLAFLRGGHLAITAVPFRESLVGHVRTPLLVLLAAVLLVLLVACANVANLLLARGAARQHELAVRAALGADRWRLVRQSAAETLVLAVIGGAGGVALAEGLRRAALVAVPTELALADRATLDARVLAVTVVVSLTSALAFGMAPGLAAARGPLEAVLRHDARAGTPKRLKQALRGFAVMQFAGALVLLTAASLLLRSFVTLVATDPGFEPRGAVALSTYLPARAYAARADILAFHDRLLATLGPLPGVEAAGIASDLPFAANEKRALVVEGRQEDKATPPMTTQSWVLGDYFRAAGISLRAGRTFEARDAENAPGVAIVSESLARRFWPGQDAIGKRFRWGGDTYPWLTVVGVVGDVKDGALGEEAGPHTYTPLRQEGAREIERFLRSMNVVVRASGAPRPLAEVVRRQLARVDPSLAVSDLRLLEQDVGRVVAPQRFQVTLLGAFALAAVLLAAVGVYGILAHFVGEQTREIGVRLALGARARDVLASVVADGLRLAALGAAVGLAVSLVVARFLRGLLFGIAAYDPAAFLAAPAVLGLVAVAACAVPAWRAARVDPVVALRQE